MKTQRVYFSTQQPKGEPLQLKTLLIQSQTAQDDSLKIYENLGKTSSPSWRECQWKIVTRLFQFPVIKEKQAPHYESSARRDRPLVMSQLWDFLSALQIKGTKCGLFTSTVFSEARLFIIRFPSLWSMVEKDISMVGRIMPLLFKLVVSYISLPAVCEVF